MPKIYNMLRAIKVRLYPNKQQAENFNKLLGCYRFVYNQMLSLKNDTYIKSGANLGLSELSKYFYGVLRKDDEKKWLYEQNTKVLQQAIRQLLVSYKNFYEKKCGFPKFKSKKDVQTALFPLEAISRTNKFESKHITLTSNFKNVNFRCSELMFKRLQKNKNNIKNATLSKTKSGKFFLSILVNLQDNDHKVFENTSQIIGIDLGVKDFIITSNGEVFENKHFFKKQEDKITKLQRQLSKKQKGSNNRSKQCIKIAKAFEKLTNKRDAYIHSVVNELLTNYDIIFMENLNVQGMLKNHKLAKAIQEIGFYRFKQVLEDKAILNNKRIILVDRWYASSKICSNCGYKYNGLTLDEREWVCPICGKHHNRDLNAAVNILTEGMKILNIN